MTKDKISVPDTCLNARTRRLFLNHLAETANVAASARAAVVDTEARATLGVMLQYFRLIGMLTP